MKKAYRCQRRGAILMCVLVCLSVATMIMMVSVRSSLRVRRQMRLELQLEQTRWLLDAGVRRGRFAVLDRQGYQGETWHVSPALRSYPHATVQIDVTTEDVPDSAVRLRVTAQLRGPDTLSKRTQRSETLIVKRPESDSEN